MPAAARALPVVRRVRRVVRAIGCFASFNSVFRAALHSRFSAAYFSEPLSLFPAGR
jgi:hypothetical protein